MIDERSESFLQKGLRLVRAIKRNPIRQFRIESQQKKLLRENHSPDSKKLIMFVTTSVDMVNGGILAICGHYEETAKIKENHGSEVVLSTAPGKKLLLKYTKCGNDDYILGFSGVLSYFHALEDIMIHIPEYMSDSFVKDMSKKDLSLLKKIGNVHINIMLQNIEGLKHVRAIKGMERLGKVTCTTAHERYSTLELRNEIGVPLHLLSVRGDPKSYKRRRYLEKDDLMIISPDEHPLKSQVLKRIGEQLPHIKLKIIANLTYEEYKGVIEKAKWALTFGEGMDGYFTETIFSGGISFSVFNSDYFTEEFRSLRTVYDSYDSLARQICSDIRVLDEKSVYAEYQEYQYALCSKYYTSAKYLKNLELFYAGMYTYQ
jgi:hypothetical protein